MAKKRTTKGTKATKPAPSDEEAVVVWEGETNGKHPHRGVLCRVVLLCNLRARRTSYAFEQAEQFDAMGQPVWEEYKPETFKAAFGIKP